MVLYSQLQSELASEASRPKSSDGTKGRVLREVVTHNCDDLYCCPKLVLSLKMRDRTSRYDAEEERRRMTLVIICVINGVIYCVLLGLSARYPPYTSGSSILKFKNGQLSSLQFV